MCLAQVQTEKEEEGMINILLLPFCLFSFLKEDSQHCNFSFFWVLWDLRPSQAVGLAMGLLVALQQKQPAHCIAFLSSERGQGCNTQAVVSLPWYSVMPPKPSQAKLIAQLALPGLAVVRFSSYTTSTTHRGSLHLLLASPVTLKGTHPHAGTPCQGNCLASVFER